MKKNKIFIKFISLISYFYPLKLIEFFCVLHRWMFNAKLKRRLKESGNNIRFFLPVSITGEEYVSLGADFTACRGMTLECYDSYAGKEYQPKLTIGKNAHFGVNCHVGCIEEISIGDNFLAAGHVYISDHGHGNGTMVEENIAPIERELITKGKVSIGNNVWLGEHVAVLPGVSIGNNVTVGANAVVTKNLPDNCVAIGVPAKILYMK